MESVFPAGAANLPLDPAETRHRLWLKGLEPPRPPANAAHPPRLTEHAQVVRERRLLGVAAGGEIAGRNRSFVAQTAHDRQPARVGQAPEKPNSRIAVRHGRDQVSSSHIAMSPADGIRPALTTLPSMTSPGVLRMP